MGEEKIMEFLNLIKANMKILLADKKFAIFAVLIPVIVAIFSAGLGATIFKSDGNNQDESKTNIYSSVKFYSEDGRALEGKALELANHIGGKIEGKEQFDQAIDKVKNKHLTAVYVVPADFNEKLSKGISPEFSLYQLSDTNYTIQINEEINRYITTELKKQAYKDLPEEFKTSKNLFKIEKVKGADSFEDFKQYLFVGGLMYFISVLSPLVIKFMMDIRKNRIYERLATTRNSGFKIMSSQFLSMVIIEATSYCMALFAADRFLGLGFKSFTHVIIFMTLYIALNVALSILITRITTNEDVGPSVGTIFAVAWFFLMMAEMLPMKEAGSRKIIEILSYLNPNHWVLYGIRDAKILPSAIILILMTLALITAGSYRFSSFSRDK